MRRAPIDNLWEIVVLCIMLAALAMIIVLAGGCASTQRTDDTLRFLERGKARGNLTITTSGQAGVGMAQDFYLGAKGTALSFNGEVDFSEPTLRKDDP